MIKKVLITIFFYSLPIILFFVNAQETKNYLPPILYINNTPSSQYNILFKPKDSNFNIPDNYFERPFKISDELTFMMNPDSLFLISKTPTQLKFDWDFGDGTKIMDSYKTKHTFQEQGTYIISVKVFFENEEYITFKIMLNISDDPNYVTPNAKINISRYENFKRSDRINVFFTAGNSLPKSSKLMYHWNIDDVGVLEGKEVSYEFNKNKFMHLVTLKVVDENNFFSFDQIRILPNSFKINNFITAKLPLLIFINRGIELMFIQLWPFLIIFLFFLFYEKKRLKFVAIPYAYYFLGAQLLFLFLIYLSVTIFGNRELYRSIINIIKYIGFLGSITIFSNLLIQKLKKENIYFFSKKKNTDDRIDYIPSSSFLLSFMMASFVYEQYIQYVSKEFWLTDLFVLINIVSGEFFSIIIIGLLALLVKRLLRINKKLRHLYEKYLIILFLVLDIIFLFIYLLSK